ncbi:MAG: hypothetical protein J7J61_10875 [Candidatus Hydrothermae bacterium]|nr:hypothetical protein [Candidatus Hydrothermae bacterium]
MPEKIEWESLPARNKKRLVIAIIAVFFTTLFLYLFTGPYWAIFGFLLLLFVLFPFYTVTRYSLDNEKIVIKKPFYTVSKELRYFRRVEKDRNGVFLSPFKKPSRLDNFRGIYLIMQDDKLKNRVFEFLKKNIEENEHQRTS